MEEDKWDENSLGHSDQIIHFLEKNCSIIDWDLRQHTRQQSSNLTLAEFFATLGH